VYRISLVLCDPSRSVRLTQRTAFPQTTLRQEMDGVPNNAAGQATIVHFQEARIG
jgi:hypothetical protein